MRSLGRRGATPIPSDNWTEHRYYPVLISNQSLLTCFESRPSREEYRRKFLCRMSSGQALAHELKLRRPESADLPWGRSHGNLMKSYVETIFSALRDYLGNLFLAILMLRDNVCKDRKRDHRCETPARDSRPCPHGLLYSDRIYPKLAERKIYCICHLMFRCACLFVLLTGSPVKRIHILCILVCNMRCKLLVVLCGQFFFSCRYRES